MTQIAEKPSRIDGMARSFDQWLNMVPHAVADGSKAQVECALADASHDIEVLWHKVTSQAAEIERLREALERARWYVEAYDTPEHNPEQQAALTAIDAARPLYAAPLPLSDLEAENARLKAEVERLEKADETRAQDISRLTIERDAARDLLAEALKALEPFANAAGEWDADENDGFEFADSEPVANSSVTVGHLRAARRVREGGE